MVKILLYYPKRKYFIVNEWRIYSLHWDDRCIRWKENYDSKLIPHSFNSLSFHFNINISWQETSRIETFQWGENSHLIIVLMIHSFNHNTKMMRPMSERVKSNLIPLCVWQINSDSDNEHKKEWRGNKKW